MLRFYPPFLGAGIRIKEVSDDFSRFVIVMPLRFYNRNVHGTHFGGSLYAMCDPFYVFILMANLGDEFIVWDKTATIHFRRPGKGTMRVVFEISKEEIVSIKDEVRALGKNTYWYKAEVKDEEGKVVAELEKEIYVRHKKSKPREQIASK